MAVRKSRVRRGLLIGALACAAFATPAGRAPLDEARALAGQGRTADALAVLRAAAAADPNDAPVRNMLGAILNREGQYPEALVHAEAAVAAAPSDPRYRVNRGIVLAEHGRFAEAVADLDFALQRDPGLTYAYLEKGSALLSLGRDDEAQRQWALARRSDPALIWPDWYESVDHFVHGRFAEAAAGFDKVAAAEPAFAAAPLWRGLAHARAGTPLPVEAAAGEEWPTQLLRFHQGPLDLDALMALARQDRISGDERRQGESWFVAGQKALLAGRSAEAETLLAKAVAVKAPRHAWKIAAQRDLVRLRGRRGR